MSYTPTNVRKVNSAGVGAKEWLPLNYYAGSNTTINLIITGTATATVEGTLVDVNRSTPTADDIFDLADFIGITATTAGTLSTQPVAAVRVNQTVGAGSTVLHVLQNGE